MSVYTQALFIAMKFHFANPQDLLPRNGDNWRLGIISRYIFEEFSDLLRGNFTVTWDEFDIRDGGILRGSEDDE